MTGIRQPCVAGLFYSKQKAELSRTISDMFDATDIDPALEKPVISVVAPHAGYAYSGRIAARAYRALASMHATRQIDTFVVVGPNHTGNGAALSVSMNDWNTPLGRVANDCEFSSVLASTSGLAADELAHRGEHSVEVQLPFLQLAIKDPKCSFICMGDQSATAAKLVSSAITKAGDETGRTVAVIASSDFNHYEPASVALEKDTPVIERILKMDIEGFYTSLSAARDTACGFGPIAVAADFAKAHGAVSGMLLKYGNSGDSTGDYSSVVAYASIAFCRS